MHQKSYLLEWRLLDGRSQADLGAAVGVNQSTIARIEDGLSPWKQDVMEKLAAELGVSVGDLLLINPNDVPGSLKAMFENSPTMRRGMGGIVADRLADFEAR